MKIRRALKTALFAVTTLWAVYGLDLILPLDLRQYGIRPRSLDGLAGIVCAPFLHGDSRHLIANSGALFVLLAVALAYNRRLTLRALGIIVGLGGLGVWLFGSAAVHIGASGVVFGLIGFLLSVGLFRREWIALAVSAAVFLAYGGALLSLLNISAGVSWAGHFYGFAAGVLAAWRSRAGA